jgi:hypothetical protein
MPEVRDVVQSSDDLRVDAPKVDFHAFDAMRRFTIKKTWCPRSAAIHQ